MATQAKTRKTATTRKAAPKAPATASNVPAGHGLRAEPTAQGKRRISLDEAMLVTVLGTGTAEKPQNPKRPGTGAWNRFAQYMALAKEKGNGKFTVGQILDAGVQPSDVHYNVRHGYITTAAAK